MKYVIALSVGVPFGMIPSNIALGIFVNAVVTVATVWIREYYRTKRSKKDE